MNWLPLLLVLSPQTAVRQTTLKLDGDAFTIRSGGKEYREPLAEKAEPSKEKLIYRKDANFAVWDSRGLSIRKGSKSMVTGLEDIAVSPKLFTKDEIRANQKLFASGGRSKAASSLAGSRRLGSHAYFLARWVDKSGDPWLEALIRVNLSDTRLRPDLLGRFEGYSLPEKAISDQLFVLYGLMSTLTRKPDASWGIATFDTAKLTFGYHAYGDDLISYLPLNQRLIVFQEKTSYGTYLVGRVDFGSEARRNMLESRVPVKFVDTAEPLLAIAQSDRETVVRNVEVASELVIPQGSVVRRTKAGVIVWNPATAPRKAVLYEPVRWKVLAKWEKQ